jgi:hypothetical protein
MVKLLLFPAGFHTYKNLIADKLLTVKNIVNDMSTDTKCARTGLELFAERFGVFPTLTEEYLNHSFEYFYKAQIARMPEKKVQYFARPSTDEIIPTEWIHATKHPAVSNVNNKIKILGEDDDINLHSNSTDNTWASQIEDIDIDLINDDMIDTSFWFPEERQQQPETTKAMVHKPQSPEAITGTQQPAKTINSDESFIETVVSQTMAKYVNAPPFIPASQRVTRSKTLISELIKTPPPGFAINPVTLSPNPKDPKLNEGFINTPQFHSPVEFLDERLSPMSPCFCPPQSLPSSSKSADSNPNQPPENQTQSTTEPRKTTITFGTFPALEEYEDKKIQAVINSSDTQLVESIKQILARHGITGTLP